MKMQKNMIKYVNINFILFNSKYLLMTINFKNNIINYRRRINLDRFKYFMACTNSIFYTYF